MAKLPEITVVIPCKNEVENIDQCIASARRIAAEVLVADSGSTDGTLEVAQQHADRVIEREYVDSGDFKNWAIPQAKHEWVFILDADERITAELADDIKQKLLQNAKDGEPSIAFAVPRRNFFLGHPVDHGDWASDKVTRLFKRECRYKLHTDHSEIDVPNHKLGKLSKKLVHYTAWDLGVYLEKMQHYAVQQAKLWHAQKRRPRLIQLVLNAPMRFLRGYVLKMGWRDGLLGFFIASLTGYYSFVKQFYFWQLTNGKTLADFESNSSQPQSPQSQSSQSRHAADRRASSDVDGEGNAASRAA